MITQHNVKMVGKEKENKTYRLPPGKSAKILKGKKNSPEHRTNRTTKYKRWDKEDQDRKQLPTEKQKRRWREDIFKDREENFQELEK